MVVLRATIPPLRGELRRSGRDDTKDYPEDLDELEKTALLTAKGASEEKFKRNVGPEASATTETPGKTPLGG
jgi:hypothetical protein